MYHSVMDDPGSQEVYLGKIVHSRDAFRAQMELLAGRFHPTSLDQVGRFVKGEGEIPSRAVVVTFDDGYTDNYEIAGPVLQEILKTVRCQEASTTCLEVRL